MADFCFGPFVLDGASRRLMRDGIEVKMRPQALAALRTLASHPGRFLTYEQLIEEAWGGTHVSRHTVNVTIAEVRKRLGDCGSWIAWRPKIGYCLRVPQYDTLVRLGWHFANLRSQEGFERALECFSGAAFEAPHDHRAFEGQAACYLMKASFGMRPGREMFEAFLGAYERAVASIGATPELRCNYAHAIHLYQRRLDESLTEFDRVIAEQPQLAMAHVRRTLLLVTMGDLDQALDSAMRSQETDPLQPLSATAEVNVRIWRREFEHAVALGQRAVQGGGQITGLFNITPDANLRLVDNFVTLADRFGGQSQSTDSVALNVTARPRFGLTLQGGFNYAKTNFDSCAVRDSLPESSPTLWYCDYSTSLLRATALGTYVVPKVDVQLAFTFRSDAGASLGANYVAANSQTTLGRPFAGASQTITVNLIEPGTLYGDRVNQFDIRVAKNLRIAGTRTNVGVDVTNVMNSNPVLTYSEAFSPSTTTWLRPNTVLQPRLVKVSAQFNF